MSHSEYEDPTVYYSEYYWKTQSTQLSLDFWIHSTYTMRRNKKNNSTWR